MLNKLAAELELAKSRGWRRTLSPVSRQPGAVVIARGREYVDYSNWDIFGLAGNAGIKRAVHRAIDRLGVCEPSSRLAAGTSYDLIALEERIAAFLGEEAAVLFGSKNQAVWSLITGLLREGDTLFTEDSCMSPAADAAFLVGAKTVVVPSRSPDELEVMLSGGDINHNSLIWLEFLSPTTGSLCPLEAMISMAERHGGYIVIDESYGLGICGDRGAGSVEFFPTRSGGAVIAKVADLSRALGGFGTAVAGPRTLIDLLVARSATFGREVSFPPMVVAATREALDTTELLVRERSRLAKAGDEVRARLSGIVTVTVQSGFGPLVVIQCPSPVAAAALREGLSQHGIICETPVSAKINTSLFALMFLLTCAHSEDRLRELPQAILEVASRI